MNISETARAYLSEPGADGMSLYQHLYRTFLYLAENNFSDPYASFETASQEVKASYGLSKSGGSFGELSDEKIEAFIKKCELLALQPTPTIPETLPLLKQEKVITELIDTFSLARSVGKGLMNEEVLSLTLSMKKFVRFHDVNQVRFVGKIFTSINPYYILEVKPKEQGEAFEKPAPIKPGETKPPVPKEDPGIGCNKFVYYVSTELTGEWIKLPHTTPQLIQAARGYLSFFTGELEKNLSPSFPGLEKDFLRAQLSRIVHATTVCPSDSLIEVEIEEEEEEDEDEEKITDPDYEQNPDFEGFEIPEGFDDPETMNDEDGPMVNITHARMEILPQGRCFFYATKYKEPDEDEEEEEDVIEPEEEEPEEGKEIFTPCSQDEGIKGDPAWCMRVCQSQSTSSPVVVTSNLWNGAFAVVHGSNTLNCYIGWGQKAQKVAFCPAPLPAMTKMTWLPSEEKDPTVREEQDYEDALRERAEKEIDSEEEEEED
ncbi:hypothetical protein PCE1_002255 [Barthelona sp. PCE]